jgi:hypothetical protein
VLHPMVRMVRLLIGKEDAQYQQQGSQVGQRHY